MSVIFIVAVFTVFTDITAYFIYYKLLCGSFRIIIQIGKSAFGYHFFGYVFHPLPLSLFLFELTVRLAFQTAALLYLVDPPQWIADQQLLMLHVMAADIGSLEVLVIPFKVFVTHFHGIENTRGRIVHKNVIFKRSDRTRRNSLSNDSMFPKVKRSQASLNFRIQKISQIILSCRKGLSFHKARCLRKQHHTPLLRLRFLDPAPKYRFRQLLPFVFLCENSSPFLPRMLAAQRR